MTQLPGNAGRSFPEEAQLTLPQPTALGAVQGAAVVSPSGLSQSEPAHAAARASNNTQLMKSPSNSSLVIDEAIDLNNPVEPRKRDILCGRGQAINNHLGNKEFRANIADWKSTYQTTRKLDKVKIAMAIYRSYQEDDPASGSPRRFLKQINGQWYKLPKKMALAKISQALRERGNESAKTAGHAKTAVKQSNLDNVNKQERVAAPVSAPAPAARTCSIERSFLQGYDPDNDTAFAQSSANRKMAPVPAATNEMEKKPEAIIQDRRTAFSLSRTEPNNSSLRLVEALMEEEGWNKDSQRSLTDSQRFEQEQLKGYDPDNDTRYAATSRR